MKLIVNADDYGLCERNSRAIAEAFHKGLITDTTMMANGEWFDEAVSFAKKEGFFDRIGIHFNLTEGEPLTDEIKNCPAFCENGKFHNRISRLRPLTKEEEEAVFTELSAQIKKLRDAGIEITHADSHHHIHTAPFLISSVLLACHDAEILKIRLHRNMGNIPFYKKIVKKSFNKNLLREGMKTTEYFGSLEDAHLCGVFGVTEIMVHPDYDKDGKLVNRYDYEDGFPIGEPLAALKHFMTGEIIDYRSI